MKSPRVFRVLNSSQNRTLISNFFYLGILQTMRYLIPILVLPYVTRIIGLQHFGEIAIASTFTLILQICVNYSFEFMGARDVARNREDKEVISKIVSCILCARCILYVISFLIICLLVLTLKVYRPLFFLIIIAISSEFFSMLVSEWFFQGTEKMAHITIINVISRVIYVILVFTLIKEENDYFLYPLCNTIGYVFAAAYSMIIIFFKQGIKFVVPKIEGIVTYLRSGVSLFINQVCLQSFNLFPNFLLGILCGASVTGIYDAAAKVSTAGEHSVAVLNKTFFPFLSRNISKHNVYAKINIVFGIIVAFGLFLFAPIITKILFAPEFAPATSVLRILAVSVLGTSVMSAYSTNYLLLLGENKIVLKITIVIFILGCGLFACLAHYFSYIGAAVAILLIKLLLATSFYLASIKHYKRCAVN